MSSGLILPDYVKVQEEAAQRAAEEDAMARVPQPTGWRLLVMPYKGREKTHGGVYIPDETKDREALATVVAYVVKLGPLA